MPLLRRAAGIGLLLVSYLPLHRLLDVDRTGPAGAATRATAEAAWIVGVSGTVIVLTLAWLCARMVAPGPGPRRDPIEGLRRLVSAPPSVASAVATGVAALGLSALVAHSVHERSPTSVDQMAQLLHAAAVAHGRLTIPLDGSAAAWVVQNGIVVGGGGWASIYPPLHTLLLALGLAAGAAWMVGPLLCGLATACATWSADRLLGPLTGRLAGLLLVVSPFWLLLGASHSSHVAAAAGLALVLLGALRWREVGGVGWALATGAAVGWSVAARPWTGLLCSVAIVGALWWDAVGRREARGPLLGAVAGGVPFAALLLWWNGTLFGHPLRLGYTAAFGPSHALGWHADPWGNLYGPAEALAYTGADLVQLGIRLFESPLPTLALVGFALLVRPLRSGVRPFAAWAGAGIVAAALYWHHGIHFGPRMLYETVPAWSALFAAAAASLVVGAGPVDEATAEGATSGHADGSLSGAVPAPPSTARRFFRWVVLIAVVGGVALAPTAVRSAGPGGDAPTTPEPPSVPAVVFVHGSWASRVSSRLVAAGMRRDSIETALRRNDICAVDRYARWRAGARRGSGGVAGPGSPPPLDFEPLPGTPAKLETRALSPGNLVRVDPTLAFDAGCRREARADRLGVVELELLAWRLPPLPGRPLVAARDLGPAGNLPVLGVVDRAPYLLVEGDDGALLLGYEEGMEMLWGGAAGEAARE